MSYKIKLNGLSIKNIEGKELIGSDFKVEIKELDTDRRTFWAIGSAESPDRDKDVIRVEGWNLKNYIKAPRGLWMHNYFEHPHFKTLKIKVDKESKQLIFQPKFDTHDRAQLTWNQYVNGFLDDFSVGFIPGDSKLNDETNWSSGREFIKGHELLEISSVTIPAHPNAQMIRNSGLLSEGDITLDKLGFYDEFVFNKDISQFWYPVFRNTSAYIKPKTIKLTNGISVVKAFPLYQEEKQETIVGYLFDNNNYKNHEDVLNWINEKLTIEPVKRFYNINFNEETEEFDISIGEEKNLPDTIMDLSEEDEDMDCTCENGFEGDGDKCKGCGGKKPKKSEDEKFCECENGFEGDGDKCKGCGGKKPKKSISLENEIDNIGETNKDVITFSISRKEVESILQLVDKDYWNEVKGIVDSFKKIFEEMKLMVNDVNKSKENKEDNSEDMDQNDELIELDFESVPPVTDNKSDSQEFEIDPEELKNLTGDAVVDLLSESFKEIFLEEKKNISGKL